MKDVAFEKRCEELDAKIEALSAFEKAFVLWRLADWRREKLKGDVSDMTPPKTATEAYALRKMSDHIKMLEELGEILSFELF